MHRYRSHTCGELRASDVGSDVRLSGWLHNRRDLGGILFIDLRDHYGITQLVARPGTAAYEALDKLTMDDVKQFHKEQLAGKNYTYCVVASDKKINMEDLKKVGDVKVLSLEELFGY